MEESERSFGVGAEEKEKEEEDREQMAVAPVSSGTTDGGRKMARALARVSCVLGEYATSSRQLRF